MLLSNVFTSPKFSGEAWFFSRPLPAAYLYVAAAFGGGNGELS